MKKGQSIEKAKAEGRIEGKNEILQRIKEYLELLDREVVREASIAQIQDVQEILK